MSSSAYKVHDNTKKLTVEVSKSTYTPDLGSNAWCVCIRNTKGTESQNEKFAPLPN